MLYRKLINFDIHFLANLNIDLDEFQYVATTCWLVEAHAHFILHEVITIMQLHMFVPMLPD